MGIPWLPTSSTRWGRKGVIIFSDGDDRNSFTRREAAMARVQASDAVLYTVGFGSGTTSEGLRRSLDGYATTTGGHAFFPRDTRELDQAFDAIVKGMDRPSHAGIITRLALGGLATLRDPRGIPVCETYAKRGHYVFVRMAAIDALGRLGDFLEPRRQEIREFLVPLLRDPHMHVRNATCSALATLGDGAAIGELRKVEQSDVMGNTQRAARRAIARLRDRLAEVGKKGDFAGDMDKLKDENAKLQQRLAKLESQVQALSKKRQ